MAPTDNEPPAAPGDTRDRSVRVELCCRATRRSFGLIDHYFLRLEGNEYHFGVYQKGRVIPAGYTQGAHVITEHALCPACRDSLQQRIDQKCDVRLMQQYFPLLNCESFCLGFSYQIIGLVAFVPTVVVLILKHHFLWALILLLIGLVVQLWVSKYRFSRTARTRCSHLGGGTLADPVPTGGGYSSDSKEKLPTR